MRVLIACEESQTTCKAFREAGHEAFSCDMVDCSGGHPEWHIKGDCLEVINGDCIFSCQNGDMYVQEGAWDLVIAHPPCTYLSNVATRAYSLRVTPAEKVVERWQNRAKAAVFFMQVAMCNAKRLCVENPIGFMNGAWRKPDQIIQPFFFAENSDDIENYQLKTTCLWLRDLPLLKRTNDLPKPAPVYVRECADGTKKNVYFEENHGKIGDSKHKGNDMAARSKTFPGVSRAMVEQWGCLAE